MKNAASLLVLCAGLALAQTPPPSTSYVGAGPAFNQLGTPRWSGWAGAFYPISSSLGIYGSTVADALPVQLTDPATRRKFYALSATVRQGAHKRIIGTATSKLQLFMGADGGPGFSKSSAGLSISLAASFTSTVVIDMSPHWALIFPVRALWMSQSHLWNPLPEAGVVFRP